MGAVRKGQRPWQKKVNVGLWEKQRHLVSFTGENELSQEDVKTEGEVKEGHGRVQANTRIVGSPKPLRRPMSAQGNSRKPDTGPGRQMPGSLKHPQSAGVFTGFLSKC